MIKREFPWDEYVEDVAEGEVVKTSATKWGVLHTYVFNVDGAYWRASIETTREEGWVREDPIQAVQVHKVSRTVEVWEDV